MATPNPSQRITELAERVRTLEAELATHKQVNEVKLKAIQDQAAERARGEEELKNKVADLTAKNAALDERSRNQEKTADRGWQLWLAALGFGFGLISLLVTASLQLKK